MASAAPCRYFIKGACTRGDRCPWSHEQTDLDGAAYISRPCTFYKKGACRFGARCINSHDFSDDTSSEYAVSEGIDDDLPSAKQWNKDGHSSWNEPWTSTSRTADDTLVEDSDRRSSRNEPWLSTSRTDDTLVEASPAPPPLAGLSVDAAPFTPVCTSATHGFCTQWNCICQQTQEVDGIGDTQESSQYASTGWGDPPPPARSQLQGADDIPLCPYVQQGRACALSGCPYPHSASFTQAASVPGLSWSEDVEATHFTSADSCAASAAEEPGQPDVDDGGWGEVDPDPWSMPEPAPPPPSRPVALSLSSTPSTTSKRLDRASSSTGSDIPPRSSSSSASLPRGACRNLWQNGWCRFNQDCRFKHIPNPARHSNEASSSRWQQQGSSNGKQQTCSAGGRARNRGWAQKADGWGTGRGWASAAVGDWGTPVEDARDTGASNDVASTAMDPWGGNVASYDPWGTEASGASTSADADPVGQTTLDRRHYLGDLDLPPHMQNGTRQRATNVCDASQGWVSPAEPQPSKYVPAMAAANEFTEPPGLPSRVASHGGSVTPSAAGWVTPANARTGWGTPTHVPNIEEPSDACEPTNISTWEFSAQAYVDDPAAAAPCDGVQDEGVRAFDDYSQYTQQPDGAIEEHVRSPSPPASTSPLPLLPQVMDPSELPDFGPETGIYEDILRCSVRFSSGGLIQSVRTAFDPDTIEVSGYPPNTPQDHIFDLQAQFPGFFEARYDGLKFYMRYQEPFQAEAVRLELDGKEWRNRTLSARLDLSRVTEPNEHDGCKVEVCWPKPKLSAWIYLDNMTKARQMLEAFAKTPPRLNGWKVEVTKPKQKNTRDLVALKLDNLPVTAEKTDVMDLCRGFTVVMVVMNRPTYTRDAQDAVMRLLDPDGEHLFLSFLMLPDGEPLTNSRALVDFAKASDAQAVVDRLHGTTHAFMDNAELRVRSVIAYRYDVPRAHLEVLRDGLAQLPIKQSKESAVVFGDLVFDTRTSRIVILGADARAVVIARLKVEKLLHGHAVRHKEGSVVWNHYFSTPAGEKVLAKLHDKDRSVVVIADRRLRQLRVIGAGPGMSAFDKTQTAINRIIRTLAAGHEQIALSLAYHQLHYITNGGLKRIRDRFGDTNGVKIIFDPRERALVVRGDVKFQGLVSDAVDTLPANAPAFHVTCRRCPVCTGAPVRGRPLPCGHEYCSTCLLSVVRAGLSEAFSPPACVAEGCDALVPQETITRQLSTKEGKALVEAALRQYAHDHPEELKFCPTAGCEMLYRPMDSGMIVRCPACRERICPSCGVLYHEGMACTEYRYEGGSWASVG